MGFIGAGLLSALVAWFSNRYLVKVLGPSAIAKGIPAAEEILKTGSALLFGVSILFTHGVFGVVEAVQEIQSSAKGLWPGILAFINHLFFGVLTSLVSQGTGSIVLGLVSAILVHSLWNWFVVDYVAKL